jgi:hypothetical protein
LVQFALLDHRPPFLYFAFPDHHHPIKEAFSPVTAIIQRLRLVINVEAKTRRLRSLKKKMRDWRLNWSRFDVMLHKLVGRWPSVILKDMSETTCRP